MTPLYPPDNVNRLDLRENLRDVLLWILTVAALLVACAAWLGLRGLSRRHERLTRQYWELRYQFGELRDRVARLDPEGDAAPPTPPQESFVPLSSLKR